MKKFFNPLCHCEEPKATACFPKYILMKQALWLFHQNFLKVNSPKQSFFEKDCFALRARNDTRRVLFLFLTIFLFAQSPAYAKSNKTKLCFSKQCLNVELAQTPDAWIQGLQNRKSLKKKTGMLFIFERSRRQGFWMKDTLIPLDMIWMNEEKRVVHIERNVPPCKSDKCKNYMPIPAALYVLEINAGEAEKLNIKIGDAAEF